MYMICDVKKCSIFLPVQNNILLIKIDKKIHKNKEVVVFAAKPLFE